MAGPQQRRLKQLCRLLRSLSRERRRQVLACHFRQGERLELESWMREGAAAPGQRPKRKLYPLVAALQSDESLSSQEEERCGEEEAAALAALEDACGLAPLCDGEDPADLSGDEGQPKKAAGGRSVVTRGICRRLHHGVTWYTAAVHLHRLTIMSQEVSDLSVALEFLVTMTGIKSMVAAAEGSFEERLRAAVPRALREHRATTRAMSLHFSIKMGTTWFLGGTFRPPTMSSLEQALKAWATLSPFVLSRGAYSHATITALLDHGRDDWLRLRAALLALMAEAGHSEAAWAERLDARHLAAEPFRQRLAELWNRQVMAQEERQQRRLGRWEKAQKRLLRVECKQRRIEALVLALLEKWRRAEAVATLRRRRAAQRQRQLAQREKRRLLRRERLERRARWGWLRRRDLTMEELLRKQSPA